MRESNMRKQNKDYIVSASKVKFKKVGEGAYWAVLPSMGCKVGEFHFPQDGQTVLDVEALENIGKALSERFAAMSGESSGESKVRNSYFEIYFTQVGASEYVLTLPNGLQVGWVQTPTDYRYGRDAILIKEICRQLAYRFGLIE